MKVVSVFVLLSVLSMPACARAAYMPEGRDAAAERSQRERYSAETPAGQEMQFIYNASVTFSVDERNMENTADVIREMVDDTVGYVSSYSSTSLVLRIRSERFDQFITALEAVAGYESKQISVRDVTEQYRDLNTRLDNLKKFKARYEELLASANNVEEMLSIERELERVTREIETLKGRLDYLNNQIAFSTITVRIEQKTRPGVFGYVFYGLYRGVRWLFIR